MKILIIRSKSMRIAFTAAMVLIMAAIAVVFAGVSSVQNESIDAFKPSERALPIYSVETSERKAAITFDCAWGAEDIPQILKVLEKSRVKATFFIVGQWALKNPDTVRMIAQSGHDVGNHSYSHPKMAALSNARMNREISLCTTKLSEIGGCRVDLFRAPYGEYNDNVIRTASQLGMYSIQWDVDSLDWMQRSTASDIYSRVLNKTRSGSIILFHNDTKHTVKILPEIIEGLQKKGFELVPVSQLVIRGDSWMDTNGRQHGKTDQ